MMTLTQNVYWYQVTIFIKEGNKIFKEDYAGHTKQISGLHLACKPCVENPCYTCTYLSNPCRFAADGEIELMLGQVWTTFIWLIIEHAEIHFNDFPQLG
jgi:hypothetical protein